MMESCEVRHHDGPDMKNSITHPGNNPNQDPNRRARQAHTSEEKSAAADYQHLPLRAISTCRTDLRPDARSGIHSTMSPICHPR